MPRGLQVTHVHTWPAVEHAFAKTAETLSGAAGPLLHLVPASRNFSLFRSRSKFPEEKEAWLQLVEHDGQQYHVRTNLPPSFDESLRPRRRPSLFRSDMSNLPIDHVEGPPPIDPAHREEGTILAEWRLPDLDLPVLKLLRQNSDMAKETKYRQLCSSLHHLIRELSKSERDTANKFYVNRTGYPVFSLALIDRPLPSRSADRSFNRLTRIKPWVMYKLARRSGFEASEAA
jgi:hypothetical protein